MKIICWACISVYFDLQWKHFKRITSILLYDFLLKIMIFADLQKRSGSKKRKAADFGQFSNFLELLAALFMICPLCCLKSLSGYLFWRTGIRTECDSCFFQDKEIDIYFAINIYIVWDWDCLIRFVLRCLGDRRRSSGGYIVSHRDKRRLPAFRVQCRGQTLGIKHLGWQIQYFCLAKKTHYIAKVKRKYCNNTNITWQLHLRNAFELQCFAQYLHLEKQAGESRISEEVEAVLPCLKVFLSWSRTGHVWLFSSLIIC